MSYHGSARSVLLLDSIAVAVHRPLAAQLPHDSDVRLVTGTGTLTGSLLVPNATRPIPVVLIIAGSGPTDRNGNSILLAGRNNSLQDLAQAFYEKGIASLRYDKRGVAMSQGAATSEADLRFDTYVDDAAKWVAVLRSDPRFTTVTIAGHSEGSLIGMIAARTAGADGYISIAGLGRNAADGLRDQLRVALPPDLFQSADSILHDLESGRTHADVKPELVTVFRPSVQPYMISWLHYVPATEVARLHVPVLIVQGTTDLQVRVAEARVLGSAKPDAQVEIIDGMNHVLKTVAGDLQQQAASYSVPLSR